jgi:hypothetical protein
LAFWKGFTKDSLASDFGDLFATWTRGRRAGIWKHRKNIGLFTISHKVLTTILLWPEPISLFAAGFWEFAVLRELAAAIAKTAGMKMGRDQFRRADVMFAWLDRNWSRLKPVADRTVMHWGIV